MLDLKETKAQDVDVKDLFKNSKKAGSEGKRLTILIKTD